MRSSASPTPLPPPPAPPSPLPIDASIPTILAALQQRPNAIIVASPGAGKTTRLAPAITRAMAAGQLGDATSPASGAVVMLQPRRVAARAAAQRISSEQGWSLGHEVGWHIRHERRIGPHTRLRILTEGILTRQLLHDPFLPGVGCVILDEFHERNLHSDLALLMLREVQRTVRPELRIVIMSATLDAQPLARYLQAPESPHGDAPIFDVPGRLFPVAVEQLRAPATPAALGDQMAEVLRAELQRPFAQTGHILAFLPGMGEIRRTADALTRLGALTASTTLHVLHSSVSASAQDEALRPNLSRKLILSTNIAETSLTIDGVATVIDSGLARVPHSDARLGLDRLDLRRISRASAEQRAGRAGRTQPGRCLRLWSAAEHDALEPFDLPELLRVDLAGPLLALHQLGMDPARLDWLDAPRTDAIERADALLRLLGALDAQGRITPLGRRLSDLPLHPRLGRLMLTMAERGHAREGATVAALLAEGDALQRALDRRQPSPVESESDVLLLLEAFRNRPDDPSWGSVSRVAEDLQRTIPERPAIATHRTAPLDVTLGKALLLAYPDRVTLRREQDAARGLMVGGRGIALEPSCSVRRAPLFLSLNPREPGGETQPLRPRPGQPLRADEARVSLASAVPEEWLGDLLPTLLAREFLHTYDEARGRVISRVQWRFCGLTIRDAVAGPGKDRAGAEAAFADWVAAHAQQVFSQFEELGLWLARVQLLVRHMPELGWPACDIGSLAPYLAAAVAGHSGLAGLHAGPLRTGLEMGLLDHRQRQALATHAPETITVPSGSRIRITYLPDGESPVLAVRLQELFGLADTPRIAAGRCPVVLHLLAPNYRPVQVTADLSNFWNTTYAEVRRDLRARYPKHPWPENPWQAPAISVGRRRPPH